MTVQILDQVARSAEVLATGDADEQQAAIVQQYLKALVCSTGRSPGKARPRRAETIDPTSDQPVGLLGRHAARVMANVPPVGDLPAVSETETTEHRQVAGWGGVPGECGVECECGVVFDNFDTIGEANVLLDQHIAAEADKAITRKVGAFLTDPSAPESTKAALRKVLANTVEMVAAAVEKHPPFCTYTAGCGGEHATETVSSPATGQDGEPVDHGIVFPVVSVTGEWRVYEDGVEENNPRDGRPLIRLEASWPDGTSTVLRFTLDEWVEASGLIESAKGLADADPKWTTKPAKGVGYEQWAGELHAFWCPEEYATGCGVCASVYDYQPASGDGWEKADGGVLMPALAVAAEAANEADVERRAVSLNFTGPDKAVSLRPDEALRLLVAGHAALMTLRDYEGGRS